MGSIIRLGCQNCYFCERVYSGGVFVTDSEGQFHICGSPIEQMVAEKITGLTWKQLKKENRLYWGRYAYCASCDSCSTYPAAYLHSSIQKDWLDSLSCNVCGDKALCELPLFQDAPFFSRNLLVFIGTICLSWLLQNPFFIFLGMAIFVFVGCIKLSREKQNLPCPRCKTNHAKFDYVGKT